MAIVLPQSLSNAIVEVLVQKLSVPAVHMSGDGLASLKIQGNRIVILVDNSADKSEGAVAEKFAVIRMNAEDINNLYAALVHCYVHYVFAQYHQSIVKLSTGQSIEVARIDGKVHIGILFQGNHTINFNLPVLN